MIQTTSENAEVRYKIGDVCRIADVQPYVLRYWESEFPVLAPDRSIPGPRTYSARELDVIGQIKRLLYDEGYTIAGAKKRLDSEATAAKSADTSPVVAPFELDVEGGEKIEKPEKSGRLSEKAPARQRSSPRSDMPLFPQTVPVAAQGAPVGAVGVGPAKAEVVPTPDPRVARVVAELKEILGILSRD